MTRAEGFRGEWECEKSSCDRDAAFWLYDGTGAYWSPVCAVHAEHAHPSIEVHAWLESGYMKPIELGQPDSPPPAPGDRRGRFFREEIQETLGWTDPD